MCNFCDNIKNTDKKICWSVRSTYADDNICEFVNDINCENCKECDMQFLLSGYEYNSNTYVTVSYDQSIVSKDDEKVIIRPFSESLQFNYCPFCAKQISENILEFDKNYDHIVCVEDNE